MLDGYEKDEDFLRKARPIVDTDHFRRLDEKEHHHSTVYVHILRVAYLAYRLGRRWKADEESLLKGALLHDFYFHDWRDPEHIINHGWMHPRIALENARSYFPPISDKVANMISSHMWPFNFLNPPRSKEALILSLSDKLVASAEILMMIGAFLARPFGRSQNGVKAKGNLYE